MPTSAPPRWQAAAGELTGFPKNDTRLILLGGHAVTALNCSTPTQIDISCSASVGAGRLDHVVANHARNDRSRDRPAHPLATFVLTPARLDRQAQGGYLLGRRVVRRRRCNSILHRSYFAVALQTGASSFFECSASKQHAFQVSEKSLLDTLDRRPRRNATRATRATPNCQ